jgi:hypothetical protein
MIMVASMLSLYKSSIIFFSLYTFVDFFVNTNKFYASIFIVLKIILI